MSSRIMLKLGATISSTIYDHIIYIPYILILVILCLRVRGPRFFQDHLHVLQAPFSEGCPAAGTECCPEVTDRVAGGFGLPEERLTWEQT